MKIDIHKEPRTNIHTNANENVTTVEPKLFPVSSYLAQRAARRREIRLDFWAFLTDTSKPLLLDFESFVGWIEQSFCVCDSVCVCVPSFLVVKGNPKAHISFTKFFFLLFSPATHKNENFKVEVATFQYIFYVERFTRNGEEEEVIIQQPSYLSTGDFIFFFLSCFSS